MAGNSQSVDRNALTLEGLARQVAEQNAEINRRFDEVFRRLPLPGPLPRVVDAISDAGSNETIRSYRHHRRNNDTPEGSERTQAREDRRARRRQEQNRQDDNRRTHGVKVTIPYFAGTGGPDVYQDWEVKAQQVFRFHRYSDAARVELAVIHFTDYALSWWEGVLADRRYLRAPPVDTWAELTRLMRKRFIPADYAQRLLLRIERLRQGPRSPEEYYKELQALLQRSSTRYEETYVMAKFLAGLNPEVSNIVLQLRHTALIDAVHHATHVYEYLIKEKAPPSRRSSHNESPADQPRGSRTPPPPPPLLGASPTAAPKVVPPVFSPDVPSPRPESSRAR